jgi:hypothetical protein
MRVRLDRADEGRKYRSTMKRIAWLAAGIAILVVAATTYRVVFPPPGIHPGAYERIHLGMFESQVCDLLGGPPRTEDPNHRLHFTRTRGERWEIWRGAHYAVAVYFDQNGRVIDKDLVHDDSVNTEPIIDRILYWLGLKERITVRE